ncbi:MAG TPA: glycosyl hydrolase family 18 protein [Armatimonadota bacterium]|nr:glycosyl hydrolase family 18 protein [Armatimonadota bacterium]
MKITPLIGIVGTAFILSACGGGGGGSSTSAPSVPSPVTLPVAKQVLGYFTGSAASMTSATSASTPITAVSIDVITVAADGSLSGTLPADLLASNQVNGKMSYACISNFGTTDFDPTIAHGALVTNRAITLQNIIALAKTANLAGINIDFEGIYPADRNAYTSFINDLAAQLHAIHSNLMLSVPAKTADSANDTWTWPYDYAAFGNSADLIQVMTYDEHYSSGSPGPVAGSDWMLASLQYAVTQIPANKILLGLPAYGYDWNLTAGSATSVAFKDIPALLASTGAIPQWDAQTNSAHIAYTASDSSVHQVWYETVQGLQVKAQFAKNLDLGGISMWALGDEDTNFWNAVTAGIK